MPESPPAGEKPLGLLVFGMAIGTFAALSTQAGTTTALIGLLFALIGGTFLAWFKDDMKDHVTRKSLSRYTGFFGTGILCGLLLGIALRICDETVLQPWAYGPDHGNQIAVADLESAIGKDKAAEVLAKLIVSGKIKPGHTDFSRTSAFVALQKASVDTLDDLANDLNRLNQPDASAAVTGLSVARRANNDPAKQAGLSRQMVEKLKAIQASQVKLDDQARRHLEEVLKAETP